MWGDDRRPIYQPKICSGTSDGFSPRLNLAEIPATIPSPPHVREWSADASFSTRAWHHPGARSSSIFWVRAESSEVGRFRGQVLRLSASHRGLAYDPVSLYCGNTPYGVGLRTPRRGHGICDIVTAFEVHTAHFAQKRAKWEAQGTPLPVLFCFRVPSAPAMR